MFFFEVVVWVDVWCGGGGFGGSCVCGEGCGIGGCEGCCFGDCGCGIGGELGVFVVEGGMYYEV